MKKIYVKIEELERRQTDVYNKFTKLEDLENTGTYMDANAKFLESLGKELNSLATLMDNGSINKIFDATKGMVKQFDGMKFDQLESSFLSDIVKFYKMKMARYDKNYNYFLIPAFLYVCANIAYIIYILIKARSQKRL